MAKKTAKKKAAKAATKPAKKAARTVKAVKKTPSKRPAPKAAPKAAPRAAKKTGVEPVSTGRGATPLEIGQALVDSFNSGTPDREIWERWFSPDITSIEGMGVGMAWHGAPAVEEKAANWSAQNTVISGKASGPYVGATGFAVKFNVEVEVKATGERRSMEEVGVYTVRDGRVTQEEFMYLCERPAGEADVMTT